MNSLNQQQYLADFAPKQSLDKYAKGADPRVISGIVALSEMQQQAAERQRASLAAGAAQGQMPTVRDKIMQMFQQANQPRQQPQQQPNPMPQEEAPQEAQMYDGGVARLPVNDQMFGYAGGGIIAFKAGDEVPRPIGEETPLSPEERARLERELAMRVIGERARAEGARDDVPAPAPERESEVMRAVKTPFRAIGEGIKSLYTSSPNATPSPIGAADQNLGAEIMNVARPVSPRPTPSAAPARPGSQADLEKLHQMAIAGGNSSMSPSSQGVKSLVKPPAAPSAAAPGASPASARPATSATTTAAQDQESKLMDLMMKQFGPQPAVESTEDRLKKRDEYVKNAPTSDEAMALLKHYDRMAKRYEANDEEEKAQRARNAYNNLATFLINTKGSSLATAGSKANAALQPLLESQETRRQTYQKQRDDQEMLLGKARYEIAQAERARKEGRYADAEKSEMEAKKLQEQARGHSIQGLGSLINAAGSREERRLTREQNDRHFGIQMEEMRLRRDQMREDSKRIKDQNDRTNRENAYGRQSTETRKAIEKAQKMLEMPGLPDDIKAQAQATLTRLQKQDNDMYERIVVRGDTDYRPSPMVKGGNSALTSKADKIVGFGAK